ncbi:MAG: MFS transporter, partial [Gemmatimonadetes bacterium]|nr:MFS transporter [Gemmatimonadota bacterium]
MTAPAAAPARTITTRVVLLCFAAVLISYLDRTNISIAAIAMQEQLGWDEATKGLVLSSFFIGYLLLQVVAGSLANRWGGRIVLGVAVLWWSLFTALTPPAAMASFAMLIAARIALGLGEAAVFPGSINMIGRWVPT